MSKQMSKDVTPDVFYRTETVKVNKKILALLKYHLMVNVLPDLVQLAGGQDQRKFRELVLEVWISDAIQEKLDREMPTRKTTKDEAPQGIFLDALPQYETHL